MNAPDKIIAPSPVPPLAPPARTRPAHRLATAGFVLGVLLPVALTALYLWGAAVERYASRAAFAIRASDATAPLEIFGAVTRLGSSSTASDGQVLTDFILSQQIVREVGADLDLARIWGDIDDPVFALPPDEPIEEVHDHWHRMTDIALDPATGILTLEVRAFAPADAQALAEAILAAGAKLVNALSEEARADAVGYAAEDLAKAETRLRAIRLRLRTFRDREQEVDPTENARAALGLVAALEEDRARARVRLDQLSGQLVEGAPQIRALRRRIETLDTRIAAERARLGSGAGPGANLGADAPRDLSDVVGDYEELLVDLEFAQQAYTLAMGAYEQAQAEARRRHRDLAVHVRPTLSEEAEYPDRPVWLAATALTCLALWAIAALVAANLRERG